MAHIAHPFTWRSNLWRTSTPAEKPGEELMRVMREFKRQALHAVMLRLAHPISGEMMDWFAPLPADFVELIGALS